MDLDARTARTLDWETMLDRLAQCASTTRGMRAARALRPLRDLDTVRSTYADVSEAMALLDRRERAPIADISDIAPSVEAAGRGGTLEPFALLEIARTLTGMLRLRDWIADHDAVRLARLAAPMDLDPALAAQLRDAFDGDGELSGDTYPRLRQLRNEIAGLRTRIRDCLEELVRGEAIAESLQDRYVTERAGRLVIPVKMGMRRGMGIVHGASASGETAYVEPAETVEWQNDLTAAESALGHEIRRILAELSNAVARAERRILAALGAATDIDLAWARATLGVDLDGTIPTVGAEGILLLRAARHPVLVLRGATVVANDLALDPRHPALVLTGPNAGGKTVALKTVGLAALSVRAGIPVAAGPDSRVDLFEPLLADIGDLQSISGDLSTFSGHLAVLRQAIERSAPGALILLDEVAVGTDPAQGAALARAVIEQVLSRGARIVLTTHYPELKAIGDPRVTVGAMEYADGRPTYRLVLGAPGVSHAFAIARAMGLPESVLERALELLGERDRTLAQAAERLHAVEEAVRRRETGLANREAALLAREEKAARELARRRDELAGEFRAALAEREAELRSMVAALQADPTLKGANMALAAVRSARTLTEEPIVAPPAAKAAAPGMGERVWIHSLGQSGAVVGVTNGKVDVQMKSMRVRVDATDVRIVERERLEVRVAAPISEEMTALRTSTNTADLRGLRLDEAILASELFLDALSVRGIRIGYLLHGHGTGALKVGVRRWLKECRYAKASHAASEADGGDAFTVVELR